MKRITIPSHMKGILGGGGGILSSMVYMDFYLFNFFFLFPLLFIITIFRFNVLFPFFLFFLSHYNAEYSKPVRSFLTLPPLSRRKTASFAIADDPDAQLPPCELGFGGFAPPEPMRRTPDRPAGQRSEQSPRTAEGHTSPRS